LEKQALLPTLALALVLSAGCGAAQPAPLEASSGTGALALERALCARVSEERAQERVRLLAALGPRLGASRSSAAAAELYAAWFAGAGLATRVFEQDDRFGWDPVAWEVALVVPGAPPRALASAYPYGGSPPGAGVVPLTLEPRPGAARIAAGLARRKSDPEPALRLVDGACTLDGRWPVLRVLWDAPPTADEPRAAVFGLARDDGALVRAALAEHGEAARIAWRLDAEFSRDRPRTVIGVLPPAGPENGAAGAPPGDPGGAPAGGARYLHVTAHAD
jgi:hypothetical protein